MPRYIVADPDEGRGWSHIFSEHDLDLDRSVERERIVRFVYDCEAGRLIHLEIDRSGLTAAEPIEVADLEDSLKNANSEALESPEDWGLIGSEGLPAWCSPPAMDPRP